jgi:hypothetical protein
MPLIPVGEPVHAVPALMLENAGLIDARSEVTDDTPRE